MIPFIQLGLSYWMSVATLIAVTMLWFWRRTLMTGFVEDFGYRPLLFVMMTLVPIITSPLASDMQAALRTGREALIFFAITLLFGRMLVFMDRKLIDRSLNATLFVTVCLTMLAIVQAYYFARSTYFGIPHEYFIANSNTLPNQLDLIYSKIRPMGTFGEPSYFGFVLFSFFYAFSPLLDEWRRAWVLLFFIAVVMLLSQSLSFFLSMGVYISYYALEKRYITPGKFVLSGVLVGSILLGSGLLDHYVERITNIADQSQELSGFVRIVGPLLLLPEYLARFPFGNSFENMEYTLAPIVTYPIKWGEFLNNGLWNFFFGYGFVAIILVPVLFLSIRENATRVYIFMCLFCNGGFLSIDKAGVFLIAVGLYRSLTYSVPLIKQEEEEAEEEAESMMVTPLDQVLQRAPGPKAL
ncbi:hypothetical protein [Chthonobacter albigriseus]|uniref:hypothetical protein n=1 Tax=Chthonobacter albigriseus TaxID=1683161 RepID=UPI0015EFB706|nr:hypothetical protein [Chthonobacter albigriseus]